MSEYFTARLTRNRVKELLSEIFVQFNSLPETMPDGQLVRGPHSLPILRSIDVGEPRLIVIMHKKLFEGK